MDERGMYYVSELVMVVLPLTPPPIRWMGGCTHWCVLLDYNHIETNTDREHANPVEKHALRKALVINVYFSYSYETSMITRGIDWAIFWCHFQHCSADKGNVISFVCLFLRCVCAVPCRDVSCRAARCEKFPLVQEACLAFGLPRNDYDCKCAGWWTINICSRIRIPSNQSLAYTVSKYLNLRCCALESGPVKRPLHCQCPPSFDSEHRQTSIQITEVPILSLCIV